MAKFSTPAKKQVAAKTGAPSNTKKLAAASPKPKNLPRYGEFSGQQAAAIQPVEKLDTIPNSFRLLWGALVLIARNWKLLLGIAAIYAFSNILLIQGLSTTSNLSSIKQALGDTSGGNFGISGALTLLSYLVSSSSGNISPIAGSYQFVAAIVCSLAIIWALRELHAGREPRLRDAFYLGMYPLIPFLLVLGMVLLQLLPMFIGMLIYGVLIGNGLVTNIYEELGATVIGIGLSLVSLYLVASSLLAPYIVSLPRMQPMAALRAARELVQYRRWSLIRKLLFLPLAVLLLTALVVTPVVVFATPIAPWVFMTVVALILVIVHSYLYALYRALL